MIELRPYQQDARYKANRCLNNKRHPLIVLGAGGGKTLTSIFIIKDRISLGKRLIVLVPQSEILTQWILECSKNNINYGYVSDGEIFGVNKDVYIAMYQSLNSLLDHLPEKFIKSFSEIITDETHRSSCDSIRKIYDVFGHCTRLGLTASPYRMDNQPLGEFYTDIILPITNTELKEKGYLCEPIIIIPDEYKNNVPVDPENIERSEQMGYIQRGKIIGDMVALYKDVFNGLPVIIPCSGYKHAKKVKKLYQEAGWIVEHLHSGLADSERKAIVNDVRNGKVNIVLSVGIGIEGMDIPGLYGIIWLRFTESLTIFIQFCGRAARIMPGKSHYILVDPVGNSVIHGRPDLDRNWKLNDKYEVGEENKDEKIQMQICPCGVANDIKNQECWICGYNFTTGLDSDGNKVDKKKRKLPKMVDGKLVYLDGESDGNNECRSDNDRNSIGNDNSNDRQTTNEVDQKEITRAQKMEILNNNLTGLNRKGAFNKSVGWL